MNTSLSSIMNRKASVPSQLVGKVDEHCGRCNEKGQFKIFEFQTLVTTRFSYILLWNVQRFVTCCS
jgi:hypothetical protein